VLILLAIKVAGFAKFQYPGAVYYLDWLERACILGVFSFFYRKEISRASRLSEHLTSLNIWTVCLATILIICGNWILDTTMSIFGIRYYWHWLYFPKLEFGLLKMADLALGLFLVAVSEELVFRKLMSEVLLKFTSNRIVLYLVSSFLFAALHLVQNPGVAVKALFFGFVSMYVYRSRGTLLVPIAVHYLTDVYSFFLQTLEQIGIEVFFSSPP
jgi:membrane protease YdiL (CAAX protease family)